METKIKQLWVQQSPDLNVKEKFSFRKRGKSFVYAWQGICLFFQKEHNARIHLAATIGVGIMSVYTGVSKPEATALILSIALVWIMEMINTALEAAMDLVCPEHHPLVRL